VVPLPKIRHYGLLATHLPVVYTCTLRKNFATDFSLPAVTIGSFKAAIYAADKLKLDLTTFESVIKQLAVIYGFVTLSQINF